VTIGRSFLLMLLVVFASCDRVQQVPLPWQEAPSLDVDLRVTVDPLEVGLLQPVTVTLDRFRREGIEVAFAPEVVGGQFLLQESVTDEEQSFHGGYWQRTTLKLLPVSGPGELQIPSFVAESVASDGEASSIATTPEKTLVVTTALLPEYGTEIEAPGDPFPTPFGGWWWIFGGVFALSLLVLLVWWLRRRETSRGPIVISVPAHVTALRELIRWRSVERGTPAEVDAFYVGVSQVLRVYLEQRFGLHAPERTTEEFLNDLEGSVALARDHRAELESFLGQCDLVKFAAVIPQAEEHDKAYQLAEAFVESTREDRVDKSRAMAEESMR
jgi:hypothetical protein